ncbi:histidine kinase-, DNA gyrase B-, and HSP90-like ATPase family protein [Asticcacaulis biprosthecium C19]|uniref:histidine kinase n=1 Tax=Asticcacaulis biprosthecium C19 TaxID=715226 RepID=F4QSH5_9CAUL|nr:ATP-binding protein [Asticcacaulis biprosthecium]EGF89695.1 histidine kinase-, DNA gyrase B-, and HSP90-like ATPase family protein [Asticcacaulis biprosthecium C19]
MRLPKLRLLPKVLKRNFPRTLMARVLLIIVLPIAIMQVLITWVFFDLHWETVTERLSEGLAGDIAWAVRAYEDEPTEANLEKIKAYADEMQVSVTLKKDDGLPDTLRPTLFVALDRTIDRALRERLRDPYWFDARRYPGFIDIRVQVEGGVLRFIAPKERAFATTGYIFIFWVLGATWLLTTVAMLFIRNQVRAIERLSEAAEKFGRGEDDPNFKPYGAKEVRAAAEAFQKMKARIQRQIEQRTTLLASVSHDLRTPLTRLKLELAMAEQDEANRRMKQDVSEMAYMIDEYLAFARGEMAEDRDMVSVSALMETLTGNIKRAGHALKTDYLDKDLRIVIREMAIQRAVSNLILNGFHYGKQVAFSAEIVGDDGKKMLHLIVDDDGPGIAPERREDAFKPFNRLDDSRNQNIQGVGLGLAIARDIVRGHGGDLTLDTSPMGGLRAVVALPLE